MELSITLVPWYLHQTKKKLILHLQGYVVADRQYRFHSGHDKIGGSSRIKMSLDTNKVNNKHKKGW